jgi:biotin carboxyl carrier protein
MKMEHQIVAPRDGVVQSVNCREGEMVQPGVELVTLKE